MNLAPIHLSVYKRLWHTQSAVEALLRNDLAKESILYISSDAAKSGHEEAVAEVRRYIRTIKGFKDVVILQTTENTNAQNTIDNTIEILNKHEKVIVLEDDVVVSKHFLKFMNDGLIVYENRMDIFGISGFLPPVSFSPEPVRDVFLSQKITFYGFAMWKNRGYAQALKTESGEYRKYAFIELLENMSTYWKVYARFPKVANYSLKKMALTGGHMVVGDALIALHISKKEMCTVFPKQTMSKNIGMDGSGTHSGVNSRYDAELTDFDPAMETGLEYDYNTDKPLLDFYNAKNSKMVNFLKYLMDKAKFHLGLIHCR